MPAVMSKTVRITPQAGTWLGLSIIPDYYAEDGFRIHPQSLQLFPASIPPPAQARRTWSSISKRPSHVKNDALFTPGRVYLRVSSVRIIPIRKKPYVLEE